MLLTCYLNKPYAWGTINSYIVLPTSKKEVAKMRPFIQKMLNLGRWEG